MKRMLLLGLLTVTAACNAAVLTAQVNQKGVKQMAEPKTSTIDQIMLEEYKALRAEILLCLQNRVTIVSLGFAAIGALFAGSVAAMSREKPYWFFSALTIGVAVTLTSLYVYDFWIAETRRLARASNHNCELEEKINNLFPGNVKALEWEHRVRTDPSYKKVLPAAMETPPRIFLLVSVCSSVGGLSLFLIFLWGTREHSLLKLRWVYRWRIPFAVFGALAVLVVFWLAGQRYEQSKHLDEIWRC